MYNYQTWTTDRLLDTQRIHQHRLEQAQASLSSSTSDRAAHYLSMASARRHLAEIENVLRNRTSEVRAILYPKGRHG